MLLVVVVGRERGALGTGVTVGPGGSGQAIRGALTRPLSRRRVARETIAAEAAAAAAAQRLLLDCETEGLKATDADGAQSVFTEATQRRHRHLMALVRDANGRGVFTSVKNPFPQQRAAHQRFGSQ